MIGAVLVLAVAAGQTLPLPYRPFLYPEGRFLELAQAPSPEERAAPPGLDGMGLVDLECTVGTDGQIEGCKVVLEGPPNKGLGAAALALAPRYRLTPEAAAAAAGRRVTLTVPLGQGPIASGACIPPACILEPPPPPPPPPKS